MRAKMTPQNAQILALKGLGFLANSEGALARFSELSGAGENELRERTGEPEFLTAVVDFLLSDEQLLTQFCEDESIDARDIHLARHVLAGE
jgi:hypothetical protein